MNLVEIRSRLQDNLAAVEARIAAACARARRKRDEVTLVAVTKYVSSEAAALLPELGVFDLGESRPQELWRKAAALPKTIRWHLVGHLQRNKVERTLPLVHLIHSVDSVNLLQAIQSTCTDNRHDDSFPAHPNVLLEFNLSGESTKHGIAPNDRDTIIKLAEIQTSDDGLYITGLMTMAAESADPEQSRPTFAALRKLRDELPNRLPYTVWFDTKELSMGMSHDFEVAIEEGATLIRIGSALFEGIAEEAAR